ncbi:GtrA family protein [Agreia bicolorata]|uniref:GtrA family protein n=1 Tax=Agreia bicolorata TaxID=110935 RepID=UPI0005C93D37|nr:GtrA family protein [Agreia bicolorata]
MASIDLLGFVPSRYRKIVLELVQFGMVGGLGFVVQVSVFNGLRSTVFSPTVIHLGPIFAMLVSTLLAIVVNWLGNRYWTFRSKRQTKIVRESVEFFAVSVVGMMIGLGCLWFSHYVLGFRTVLADNISGNVIGLVLGAAFRFVLYRFWVFNASRSLDTVSVTAPVAVVSETATRSS